jgi:hypothetical protein
VTVIAVFILISFIKSTYSYFVPTNCVTKVQIQLGRVALNNKFWIFPVSCWAWTYAYIFSISSLKPISSIWSASSKIITCNSLNFNMALFIKSMSLPGVPTTKSAPFFTSSIWVYKSVPMNLYIYISSYL